MIRRFAPVALTLGLTLAAAGQIIEKNDNPGSLFRPESYRSLYEDRTARRVGDILTILVSEVSSARISASIQAKKDDASKVNQELFIERLSRIFKPWNTSANSSISGSGSHQQQASFTARLTAVVTHVMPNGLLVIEGNRTVVTNREVQTFRISGVVRPDDITPLNTVRSEQIAEAEIKMTGSGVINDRQRRGLLTQILDWLF